MKRWLIAFLAVSGCAPVGSFCDLYTVVNMSRAGAEALVPVDRPASENIAVNEELHRECR